MELVGKAYQHHMKGEMVQAMAFYDRSLELFPTAEAFTFRGWAKSRRQEYEAAIADCHCAIDVDPEFGNPYNDIGAYYIELGQPEDGIPWLRMALKAKRYESYCFPYFNLGRIFENMGKLEQALDHYEKALSENAGYVVAARAIERVKEKMRTRERASSGE